MKERRRTPKGEGRGTREELDNVITLPRSGGRENGIAEKQRLAEDREKKLARQIARLAGSGEKVRKGLMEIARHDSNFEPENFIKGAKIAYEMIVLAYAEGNRKQLRQLLSRDVYEGFSKAIEEREKKGLRVDSSFVGINQAKIVDAAMHGDKTARITVRFVSSLITSTLDENGNVVDGDPHVVREVTDIWTFSRDVSSRDPNWKLEATESAA